MIPPSTPLRALAEQAKAWPFEEARKILARYPSAPPDKGFVLFETGYGPSGLPHIGTFGEVARTTMVRHAFATLSDLPTKLYCFSDDLDGLRKVPGNVPNQDMLRFYAETRDADDLVTRNPTPLTDVPDPFGTHESFGRHNNARLRAFLDAFGFAYEFRSATDCYRSGLFDATLVRFLERHEAVKAVVDPTLSEKRRRTYSPFLPVVSRHDPALGRARLQVLHHLRILEARPAQGTAIFQELSAAGKPIGAPFEHPVTGGHCKLQWKADWAMRWVALAVDYEMAGKDLIPSVELSSKICRELGTRPPEGFNYELFLDEKGEKISKSKGNGLAIEDWLRYATPESLALFMYQKPRTAKRLYFDVIPRTVDDYLAHLEAYPRQSDAERLDNPVWHIHEGAPPGEHVPVSFAMLLNLVSASNAHDKSVLWGFIRRYAAEATPERCPLLDRLAGYAIAYFDGFVRPQKRYRPPTDKERAAMAALADALAMAPPGADGEALQNIVYEIGKAHRFEPLRDWFRALYEVLFGEEQGPRFGSFVALYGVAESVALIRAALSGQTVTQS